MKQKRKNRITTTPQRDSAVREKLLRGVAHMIAEGASVMEIQHKHRLSSSNVYSTIDTVIERWTERSYEEKELVEIASQRQDGLGRTAIEDYAKSKEEVRTTYERCPSCNGLLDREPCETCEVGKCDECAVEEGWCKLCKGKGEIKTQTVVHTAKGDPKYLKIAADCFDRSAKYRGLYIQRKDLREDQADQVKEQHDHKHIHIEQSPYRNEPSEALIAVQTMLEQMQKGELKKSGILLEGTVVKAEEEGK